MKPIDVIQQPINSSIEEWCIKQAEKNRQRVFTIMRAAGITKEEAIKRKVDEDKVIIDSLHRGKNKHV